MEYKTVALIPALNCEKHIQGVVQKARQHVDLVVVCDSLSDDGTSNAARKAGAMVVAGERGLGLNLQAGMGVINQLIKPECVVLLDGDGQHDGDQIPLLLKQLHNHQMAVGCRDLKPVPIYRKVGATVLKLVFNTGRRVKLADPMIGFLAIQTRHIPNLTEAGWGVYIELLTKTRKLNTVSVPVNVHYHDQYSDNSTSDPISQGFRLLYYILKWKFKEIK